MDEGLKKLNEKDDKNSENVTKNQKSIFSVMPSILTGGFFKSEWSFANVRIKDTDSICYFGKDNEFYIASKQGNFYKTILDLKKGGDCEIKEKIEFAK